MSAKFWTAKQATSSYQNFGCEFLDLEETVPPEYTEVDYILLDLEFVRKTLDEKYSLEMQAKNGQHIDNLVQDISKNGLKLPGTLVCDSVRVKLQDGNHRFIACDRLGYTKFPVKLQSSDGVIKSGGYKYLDFIHELFKTAVE